MAYRARKSSSRRRAPARRAGARTYKAKPRARASRSPGRTQTVRIVFSGAPGAVGTPPIAGLAGTQLVMPSAPKPRRARF